MMTIYGVDGEHGNDSNSGIVTVISEDPLVIDWSNAWKTFQNIESVTHHNGDIFYVRGENDSHERITYNPDYNLPLQWEQDYDIKVYYMGNGKITIIGEPCYIIGVGGQPILNISTEGNIGTRAAYKKNYFFENFEFSNIDTYTHRYLVELGHCFNMIFKNCKLTCRNGSVTSPNSADIFWIDCEWNFQLTHSGFSINGINTHTFINVATNVELIQSTNSRNNIFYNSLNGTNLQLRQWNRFIKSIFIGEDITYSNSATTPFFEECIIKELKNIQGVWRIKNTTILTENTVNEISVSWSVFENCIIWNEEPIVWNGDFSDVKFKNCIARNFPAGAELINCVETGDIKFVDPANDDFSLQQESPARKANWTGETPIDEDLGAIPYQQVPEIYTVYTPFNHGDIPLMIGIYDDDPVIMLEIEFSVDNEQTWQDCTLKYNPSGYGVAGEAGQVNEFLWNTVADIPGIEPAVKIRARGTDSQGLISDWAVSDEFSIDNENVQPEVFSISPLSVKIKEDKFFVRVK